MAKTRGTGLLMVWADIDPEHEAEYNRWYDEEHIAHLLAVPGFLSAGRYEALKGGPKYLALYELEAPEVLRILVRVAHCKQVAEHQYLAGLQFVRLWTAPAPSLDAARAAA